MADPAVGRAVRLLLVRQTGWALAGALLACNPPSSARSIRIAEASPPPAMAPSSSAPGVDAAQIRASVPAPSAASESSQREEGAKPSGAPDEDDQLFADCTGLWRRWKPEPLSAPPKARPGALRVVPPVGCPTPSGWAGISIWSSQHLFGFSADSRSFVNGCDLLGVVGGKTVSVCGDDVVLDGRPLIENPSVAARLRRLGVPAREGRWPRDDLYVRWSVAREGTIVYELCSDVTSKCVQVHTFPGEFAMPLAVERSPDGAWLALVSTLVAGPAEVTFLKVDALVALVPRP